MKKNYRLLEINHPLMATYWIIEKKGLLGWYQPCLTYAENATFYKKEDAEKEYDFLIGKTIIKTTQLKP